MSILLSQMKYSDITEVKKLEIEADLSSWLIMDYVSEIKRNDSIALVAKISDKLVGFLLARLIIFRDTDPSEVKQCEIEIFNIGVKNQYRRKGIGDSLFRECFRQNTSPCMVNVWLEVRRLNRGAVEFYKKYGFNVITVRKNYYQTPIDDALIMNLNIKFSEKI